jgi:hypothetical protein
VSHWLLAWSTPGCPYINQEHLALFCRQFSCSFLENFLDLAEVWQFVSHTQALFDLDIHKRAKLFLGFIGKFLNLFLDIGWGVEVKFEG